MAALFELGKMSLGVGEWAPQMRTWLLLFVIFAAVGVSAGCHSNSATSSPTPIPTQSNRAGVTVLAFGDDFTVGLGTAFCGVSTSGPCATLPSSPGVSTTTNPSGWAQMLGGYIKSTPRWQPSAFVGLGVNGALSGDAPKPEATASGDLLTNSGQIPNLKTLVTSVRSTNVKTLVVIQSGINDALDAFYTQLCVSGAGTVVGGGGATLGAPCTASGTTLAPGGNPRNGTLYAAFSTMLADMTTLPGGVPEGVLIVGVPDIGAFPWCAGTLGAGNCAALSTDVQQANAAIQDAIADASDKQVAFADWYTYFNANPTYYGATYYSADGFHLNDSGYAIVFQNVVEPALLSAVNNGTFNMSVAVGSAAGR